MDILPADIAKIVVTSFKALVLTIAAIVVAVNYFHSKEAKKMENKLSVSLPGSVHLAMSLQLFFSIVFIFSATVFLLLF